MQGGESSNKREEERREIRGVRQDDDAFGAVSSQHGVRDNKDHFSMWRVATSRGIARCVVVVNSLLLTF